MIKVSIKGENKMKYFIIVILFVSQIVFAQSPYGNEPLAHTYSIVAKDKNSGEMGVAVQSHWFSVDPSRSPNS